MSGIISIFHKNEEPVAMADMERLMQGIAWRGPDQQGCWIEGGIALGAVQLWTTAEDWGKPQPVQDANGNCLVLDGRLDNRVELIQSLRLLVQEAAAWSDAQLLLAAYQFWGTACLDHLAGNFAFALWDAARRRLVCARDPMGMRPFFYHWDGTHFYAASNLQALRRLSFLSLHLNEDYIWDFLTSTLASCFDLQATPFQEVQRLPSGHLLEVGERGLQVHRYWRPWELPPIHYNRDQEYAAHYRNIFETVVAAHSRAAGPVGVALSGGLDSSSVACVGRELALAGRLPAPDLHTFTMVWERAVHSITGYKDGAFADAVNEKYKGPSHSVICDSLTMFDEIPHRGPVPQDEPYFHIYTPWRYLNEKVHETGIRVLLTGVGADEGITANLLFVADWMREGRVRDALQVMKNTVQKTSYSYSQVWLNLVLGGWVSRSMAYRLSRIQPRHVKLGLGRRFYTSVPPWIPNPDRMVRRSLERHRLIPRHFKEVATQVQFEPGFLLDGDNGRLWSDQYVGLTSNVEQRHPYFDRRIVEFFLRIPMIQKLGRSGERKSVARRAMAGTLPEVVRLRDGNTDYGFVFREGLTQHWKAFQSMFHDSRAATAGFIDAPVFLKELEAKRMGAGNASNADVTPPLAVEFWLREIEEPVSDLIS
jgi:asparagine synthase (glutamine-hydrolysing)